MKRNIIEKIWNQHVIEQVAGFPDLLAIDRIFLHEVTSAQAFSAMIEEGVEVFSPKDVYATLDHSIPTSEDRQRIKDPQRLQQVTALREYCRQFGIELFDMNSGKQGIVHVIGPELGLTLPGSTIICGDSHTSTHGAFGALAFGVGTTQILHALSSGALLQEKPKTMLVRFVGELSPDVYAKDIILKLIAHIGIGGATEHIIEYQGAVISKMSMEERMTICNMSIECGARAGLIAPDQTTLEYLKGCERSPKSMEWQVMSKGWLQLTSDAGCSYDKSLTIDLSHLEPMVTWGTNPEQAIGISQEIPKLDSFADQNQRDAAEKALKYVGLKSEAPLKGESIQWAFIGSCTNGRLEDLRVAAKIAKGKKISPLVQMYIVPGSEKVYAEAESEGLLEIFRQAGAQVRRPGCSMCLGMNDDRVPSGERCISTSNRNFVGRQGKGSQTHLASPATVMKSAIAGQITA